MFLHPNNLVLPAAFRLVNLLIGQDEKIPQRRFILGGAMRISNGIIDLVVPDHRSVVHNRFNLAGKLSLVHIRTDQQEFIPAIAIAM